MTSAFFVPALSLIVAVSRLAEAPLSGGVLQCFRDVHRAVRSPLPLEEERPEKKGLSLLKLLASQSHASSWRDTEPNGLRALSSADTLTSVCRHLRRLQVCRETRVLHTLTSPFICKTLAMKDGASTNNTSQNEDESVAGGSALSQDPLNLCIPATVGQPANIPADSESAPGLTNKPVAIFIRRINPIGLASYDVIVTALLSSIKEKNKQTVLSQS